MLAVELSRGVVTAGVVLVSFEGKEPFASRVLDRGSTPSQLSAATQTSQPLNHCLPLVSEYIAQKLSGQQRLAWHLFVLIF